MGFTQTALLIVEILSVIVAIFIIISIIFLVYIEKKISNLNKIYTISAKSKRKQLIRGLESLKRQNRQPQEVLDYIDSFARMFLREKFAFGTEAGYGEMQQFFAEKGKTKLAFFCQKMIEARYSGQAFTKNDLDKMIKTFEIILTDYEKSLRHEMNEAVRRLYIEQMNIPFTQKMANIYFALKRIIERRPAKAEETKAPAPEQTKPTEEEKEYPKETFFVPEKYVIKKSKPSKSPVNNQYVQYIDVLDRIENKIRQIKEQKKAKV